jgi:hypothetical protein
VKLPQDDIRRWRSNVINGRLSLDRQIRLVKLFEEVFVGIHEWERAGLLPAFIESEAFLKDRCLRIKQHLDLTRASAERIFDEIAGSLPPPASESSNDKSLPYRLARALLRRIARKLRRG